MLICFFLFIGSAAQIVPAIVNQTKSLTQIIRSQHWILPPTNVEYPPTLKWIFRNIPFAMRLHRFQLFYLLERQFRMYRMTEGAKALRKDHQAVAEEFIRRTAPEKYHRMLIPDIEIGCKVGP